jgi:hypothetical protein
MLTKDGKRAINTCYTQGTPRPSSAVPDQLLQLQSHDTIGDR